MKIVIWLLIILNIAGFVVIAIDKYKAIKHKWRISERILFLFAIFGGSIGVYSSMLICRHKTKHMKFMIGVPVIIALQALLAWRVV